MNNFWNERFSSEEYIYGKEPNEFFKKEIENIKPGKALFLGEGEGRNAVYAAKLGWDVDAIDSSSAGKDKALKLAAENDVNINYSVFDLNDWDPNLEQYDLIVIIFLHLLPNIRKKAHDKVVKSLKPVGKLILQVFDKDQLKFNTGGPKNIDLLYSLEDVYTDFQDLEIEKFSKETIHINEGEHHKGKAVVINYVGVKN
ncbi:tellurite methyltransferase [bacterium BMS3Abin04]|nr:tellurite methyltransferase [bacterium BMS3Abin04]